MRLRQCFSFLFVFWQECVSERFTLAAPTSKRAPVPCLLSDSNTHRELVLLSDRKGVRNLPDHGQMGRTKGQRIGLTPGHLRGRDRQTDAWQPGE
jgi:hypothetical protein